VSDPRTVRLQNGSIVAVKTLEVLSGERLRAGQEVILTTSVVVTVDGLTVIESGTPVIGFVQEAGDAETGRLAV
jgi:hypothetical protein